jgi:hypothetical protein
MSTIKRPGIYWTARLRVTEDGDIVTEKVVPVHSFVQNFAQLIKHGFDAVSNSDAVDVTGTARYSAVLARNCYSGVYDMYWVVGMNCIAAAGEVNRGVVVGTGNTAFAVTQYNLAAAIAHGSAVGQMSYAAMANPAEPSFSNPTNILTLSRDIANSSTTSITVREIGLKGMPVGYVAWSGNPVNYETLFLRDVIPDTPVAAGQVLNVQYNLTMVM